MVSIITRTEELIASRTSTEEISSSSGKPVTKFLPRTRIVFSEGKGYAEPTVIFTCSAILSPINKLYLLRI